MDHTRLGDGGKGNCATPGLKHEHSADPHSRTKSDRIRDEVLDIALIFLLAFISWICWKRILIS